MDIDELGRRAGAAAKRKAERSVDVRRGLRELRSATGADTRLYRIEPDRARRRAVRVWMALGAAAALVATLVVLLVSRSDPDGRIVPAASTAGDTSTVAVSTTAATPTAPATTVPVPVVDLARPVIDVEWCRPTWARTREVVFRGAYLWPLQEGLPIQVFVPSGETVARRFAVAVRITDGLRLAAGGSNTEVNGQPARLTFADTTWGELLWALPDGSEAYLRTSSMTADELVALAAVLEPRQLIDPLPGLDSTSESYEQLAGGVTPITLDGVVESACEADGGGSMTATVIEGTLAQALFLTDRPAVPMAARSLDDGRLLVVTGREDIADRSQDALAGVRDATDDEWAQLTAADPPSAEASVGLPT